MHDLLEEMLRYARGIWRFRWPALATMWFVCIVGWVLVARMPDEYQASARIHIDTQSVLRPLLRGLAISTDSARRIELMTKTLLSIPNLEKLARMTDLDIQATTPELKEEMLDRLADNIRITSTKKQDLYTISFSNPDRDLSKRIVQSIITIWVESTLGENRSEADSAQKFIEEQIRDYEQKLTLAEERLSNFKRKNVGMLPGSGENYYSSLQSEMANLQQAELALQETRNRRRTQQRQLDEAEQNEEMSMGLFSSAGSGVSSPIEMRIQSLQSQMDEMLLKYTEQHPDVIEIQRLIIDLQEQLAEEQSLMVESGASSSINPMLRQMQMLVDATDAQIASMVVRVQEYQRRVDKLKNMVDTIPQIEAELKRLNRDYDVNKRNYEELLKRREAASISEKAEIRGDDIQFKVVDPPHVPLSPSGPDRLLFMSIILLVGAAVGFGLAFLLSQLRPVFDDVKNIKDITGYPVLGVVSMVRTDEYVARQRMKLAAYAAVGLLLVGTYGGFAVVEILDLDVVAQITSLVGIG